MSWFWTIANGNLQVAIYSDGECCDRESLFLDTLSCKTSKGRCQAEHKSMGLTREAQAWVENITQQDECM